MIFFHSHSCDVCKAEHLGRGVNFIIFQMAESRQMATVMKPLSTGYLPTSQLSRQYQTFVFLHDCAE